MPANTLYFRTSATQVLPSEAVGYKPFTVEGQTEVYADAYKRYGISLEETSLSRLMTPAPNKEIVENKSDLEHGKRVYRDSADVRKDERNVSLIFNITAKNEAEFMSRYALFCEEILDKGFIDIRTEYSLYDTVYDDNGNLTSYKYRVFRMTYLDCTQFTEFNQSIGKFTLSLNEPDPTNRGENDSWET